MKYIKYFEDKDVVWEEYWEDDDDKDIIISKEFTDFLIDNNAYGKFIYTINQQQLKVKGKSNMALLSVEEVNKIVKKNIGSRSNAYIIYFTIMKSYVKKSLYWINLHKKWFKLWKSINESKDIDWEDFDDEEIDDDIKVGDVIEVKPDVIELTTSKKQAFITPDTPYEPYPVSCLSKDRLYRRAINIAHKKDGTQVIKIQYSDDGKLYTNNYWCWFYANEWQKVDKDNVNESKDVDWEDFDEEEDSYITGPIPKCNKISDYKQYVGRTVRLKPGTRYYKKDTIYNPANVDGILNITSLFGSRKINKDSHIFNVNWNNGESNAYTYSDLILVDNVNESKDINWEDFDTEEYQENPLGYDYDLISIYANTRRGIVEINCGKLINKKNSITVNLLDKDGKLLYQNMNYFDTNKYLKDNIYNHGSEMLIILKDKDIMKYKYEIEDFVNKSKILKDNFIFDLSIVGGRYQNGKWKYHKQIF